MALELCLRSAIGLLLFGTAMIGGCDRQSDGGSQADQNLAAANATAPAPAAAAGKIDRSHKGEAAPSYPFKDETGATRTLADFRGKPVLVNLWATWCAPCVKEMPTLDALAEREGDKLHLLTISQDFDAAKVQPFFDERKFKRLKPYLDTDTVFSLGLGANLPTTILYDASGKEVWRMAGEADWSSAESAKLIAEAG